MNKRISVILAYMLTFFLSFSIFPVSALGSTDYVSNWDELKTALESGETDIYIREEAPIVATSDINVILKNNETVRIYSASGKDVISMDYTNYSINVSGKGNIRFENIPFSDYSNPCIVNKDSKNAKLVLSNCGFFNGDGETVKGDYLIENIKKPTNEIKKTEQKKLVGLVPWIPIGNETDINLTDINENGYNLSVINNSGQIEQYNNTVINISGQTEQYNNTETNSTISLNNCVDAEHEPVYKYGDSVDVNITLYDPNINGIVLVDVYSINDIDRFGDTINNASKYFEPVGGGSIDVEPVINTYNRTSDGLFMPAFLYRDDMVDPSISLTNDSGIQNHVEYFTEIEKGKGSIKFWDVSGGKYCIICTYVGDNVYEPSQYIGFFEVEPIDTNTYISVSDLTYGETGMVNFDISVPVDNNTNIDYLPSLSETSGDAIINVYEKESFGYDPWEHEVVNGTLVKTFNGSIKDGKGNVEIYDLDPGDYYFHAIYSGDDSLKGSDTVEAVSVKKASANLTCDKPNGYLFTSENPGVVGCHMGDNVTGEVAVVIDNETYGLLVDTLPIKDEAVSYNLSYFSNLTVGLHNLTFAYKGDDYYDEDMITVPLQVIDKISNNLTMNSENTLEYGDDEPILVNIFNSNGLDDYILDVDLNTSVNMKVTNLITNNTVYDNNIMPINGNAGFSLPYIPVGNYVVDVHYSGNEYHYDNDAKSYLNIIKAKPNISLSTEIDTQEQAAFLYVDVTDKREKPVKDGVVNVQVSKENGDTLLNGNYSITNGSAEIVVNNLSSDNYTASAKYVENDNYTDSEIEKVNFSLSELEEATTTSQQVTTNRPTAVTTTKNNAETTKAKKVNYEKDEKYSKYCGFKLKQAKVTKKSIKINWKKVKGAKKYEIYYSECGKNNKCKKLTTTKKNVYTIKKLKKGTYYKYRIEAINANGKVISISKLAHIVTKGSNKGNAKKIKVNKKKVILKKGKTFKLKAKEIAEAKKRIKIHRKLSYESNNNKIATVTNKGVIKAKAKGKCFVYVYAQNGVSKKVKVIVK